MQFRSFFEQNIFFLFIRSEKAGLCNASFYENHYKELAREQLLDLGDIKEPSYPGGVRGSWANFAGGVFPFLSHFWLLFLC